MDDEDAARAEVDRWMEEGLAALEKEQYDTAADRFRRVVQKAPFRLDARNYLAFALDRQFGGEAASGGSKATLSVQSAGASSAAAAASGRPRASRIRFPIWMLLGAIVATGAVVVLASVATRYGKKLFEKWSTRSSLPAVPRLSPAAQKLADEIEKATGAVAREQYDEALRILEAARPLAAAAEPPYDKAVEEQLGAAYAGKARAYCNKENYDKALETALEGLRHADANPQLNYVVGLCYERKGLQAASKNDTAAAKAFYEKSCRALEKARDADPHNLLVLELLGKSYVKFGDEIKAVETWQRIVREAPESAEAKNARNYLESRGYRRGGT